METLQAAFTIKEVRELMKLRNVGFHPVDRSLIPEEVKTLPRATRRMMELLIHGTPGVDAYTAPRSWSLDSCLSPRHFLSSQENPRQVASTEFAVTKLLNPAEPSSRTESTGQDLVLPSDVVFRSVGYKSVPLAGYSKVGIHFDERSGTLTNDGLGRALRHVSDDNLAHISSQQIPGLYCAGWLKTGPTGVIASTMQDAFTTGDAIVQDWISGKDFLDTSGIGWDGVKQEIKGDASRAITWEKWRKIDAAEKARGHEHGKFREKFTSTVEMLGVLS